MGLRCRFVADYEALTRLLQGRSEPVVVLTFAELDQIVGGLPASARKHNAWWSNSRSSRPHSRYWLDAGRRASPDFNAGRVQFTIGAESPYGPRAGQSVADRGATTALNTSPSRPVPTGQKVSATLAFEWLEAGKVRLDGSGKLAFPGMPARPGVYRFNLCDTPSATPALYIGESDNLARRMGNYRNPGPTQPTNQRLNTRIIEVIQAGGVVAVWMSTSVAVDGQSLDLSSKPARLLAENAALVRAAQEGLDAENL